MTARNAAAAVRIDRLRRQVEQGLAIVRSAEEQLRRRGLAARVECGPNGKALCRLAPADPADRAGHPDAIDAAAA